MTTKSKAQPGAPGKAEVDHAIVAWALAGVLAAQPENFFSRAIVAAADKLGASIGAHEAYDLRAEFTLRNLLDAHTSCAYDLDGQDRRKGKRAYDSLVALAGGAEGAVEPEDKTSCAWVCWTMRRIRAGFMSPVGDMPGGPQEKAAMKLYRETWREVETLLFPLWNDRPGDKSVHDALSILGTLVMFNQLPARLAAMSKGRAKGKGRV
jgi:hypothetical protein